MDVKYVLRGTMAVGLVGALAASAWGEGDQPHAEYQSVSPTLAVGFSASGGVSNSTPTVLSYYSPAVISLEALIPREHLIIQVSSLAPPSKDDSSQARPSANERTGANPFFQRRPRVSRIKSDSLNATPRRDFRSRRT